jgi:tetratricopeptide (TPR) repeat protein
MSHTRIVGLLLTVTTLFVPAFEAPAQTATPPEDCLKDARGLIEEGMHADAYQVLSECRKEHPDDVNLAALLADVMITLGSNMEAKDLLNHVLSLESGHKEARLKLAQLHLQWNEIVDARTHAEFLVRTFPDWPEGHNLLGRCLSDAGDVATAELHFKRAISLDPANSTFAFNAGVVLLQQENTSEALELFTRAVDLDSDCNECRFWRGRCLLTLGRQAAAISAFQDLIDDDEWGAKAAHRIGVLMLQSGKPDSAVIYLERAVAQDQSEPAWYDYLANAYAQVGRAEDAVKAYERAGSLVEEKARFNYEQGRLLLGEGKSVEAARLFRAAVDEDEELAPAWLGLAYALKSTKPLAAADALRQYIELTPKDLEKRLLLVRWLCDFKFSEEGHAEAVKLLEEKLTGSQFQQLGSMLLELDQAKDAERALSRAVKKGEKNSSLYHNLGVACERMGDLDKAINNYEKELEVSPDHLRSRLSLTILYFNLERDAEARKHIEILTTKHPGTEEAQKAHEILSEIERLEEQ